MSEASGPTDHWAKDEQHDSCTQCDMKFTTTKHKTIVVHSLLEIVHTVFFMN